MADADSKKAPRSKESIANVLIVAIGVSLVCSVLVSGTAVLLKPQQDRNQTLYRQRIVLEVAELYEPGADVDALFAGIDAQLVDLETGDYVTEMDAREFDMIAVSNDADLSVAIPGEQDSAGIRRRAIYAPVFLVRDGGDVEQVILPVYGRGLWSTMYGYLSLEPDGNTVRGLRFYEHAETPGIGDQIDRPDWLSQWPGKQLFAEGRTPRIAVARGQVQPGPDAIHQVDGLSGATLTARGVTDLLQYWTGPNGFGPYLQRISNEAESDD